MKLTARRLSGEIVDVTIDGPAFKSFQPHKGDILDLPWIAPGLVDIQINGFAGIDFNRPLKSDDAWHHATQQLYAQGCTSFLIALITNQEEGCLELLTGLTARLNKNPRNCLGFHMEGPWLNPGPAYRGAHRAEWMGKPSVPLLQQWLEIAGENLKLITLAPEIDLEETERVMEVGRRNSVRFFIGHSGAMGAELERAVAAGAAGWTHLGNAAPALAPKFENVLMHALSQPRLMASLIPDGLHVPPHAFRALACALERAQPSRLILTTDAMAGAAADGPGKYTLGEVEVVVGPDGSARLPAGEKGEPGRLAGSTLTPFQGVFRCEQMTGLYLEDAWRAFSTRPASLFDFRRDLAVGHPANFCLISPEKEPYLLATYHCGKCVYEAP